MTLRSRLGVAADGAEAGKSGRLCATAVANAACIKAEDEDTGRIYFSNICCKMLDKEHACKPGLYAAAEACQICVAVTPETVVAEIAWLPQTCAYRLRDRGEKP